jgi:hypothetical protein
MRNDTPFEQLFPQAIYSQALHATPIQLNSMAVKCPLHAPGIQNPPKYFDFQRIFINLIHNGAE